MLGPWAQDPDIAAGAVYMLQRDLTCDVRVSPDGSDNIEAYGPFKTINMALQVAKRIECWPSIVTDLAPGIYEEVVSVP